MKIYWTDFAKIELQRIFDYYKENVSLRVAKNLVQNLVKEPHSIIKTPYIGQMEVYLPDRSITYRYIIYKSYKIIYSVDEENGLINIADVFDTRQNPVKISRKK